MNRIIYFLTLLVLCSCTTIDRSKHSRKMETHDHVVLTQSVDNVLKKRLLILPFLDADPVRPENLRKSAQEAMIIDLNRSGHFIAVDQNELSLDLSKFMQKGEYKLNDIAKEAAQHGITSVLEGKILDIKVKRKSDNVGIIRQMKSVFEIVAKVRIVSGKAGNEIFNTIKTVTLEEGSYRIAERVESDKYLETHPEMIEVLVKDAFLEFSPQIVMAFEKISWEGRIAAVNGDRYYVNVGKISGLQVGDILKVTDESEDVYDPESGGHIGKVPGRLKGTLEVISFFGNDGSIAIIHSGSGFKENDKVEIY